VKSICDRLGPEFEVVPLDLFLKYAGENPTFKERYLGTTERAFARPQDREAHHE